MEPNSLLFIEPNLALAAIEEGACLVDVRTKKEFEEGHLETALHIPHDQLAGRIAELAAHKQRKIILYCKSGGRSQFAAELLRAEGFSDCWNAGGYADLIAAQNKLK